MQTVQTSISTSWQASRPRRQLGEFAARGPYDVTIDRVCYRSERQEYSFRGAVEGVVIQQVEVLPEELTVHLGSYGAGAGGNRRA